MKQKLSLIGFFIWMLASVFYLYEFFLQVFMSTVSNQVIQDLHLDASSYSIIAAAYFLPYSLMQIPVGILVDRFGARSLLTISVLSCALGVFGFSITHHFGTAFIGRAFMGLGASSAYVSLLVLALNWFPKRHFGLMVGIANLLGAMGPFLAGGPLSYILSLFNNNWRLILMTIGGFGLLLSIMIGVFVRNSPSRKKNEIIHLDPYLAPLIDRLKSLIQNKQAWRIALFSAFVYVSLPLLGAYWGTSYLQAKGLSRTVAASLSSILWIGYAVGAPLSGKISDSIKRRKLPLIFSSLIGMITSSLIVYLPTNEIFTFAFLFFCIGLASSGCSPAFAVMSENVQENLQATSIGFNNSAITLSAAILPPIVSLLIEWGVPEGVHNYSVANFQQGLFLMPIFYTIAFFISLFLIRETYCRSQHQVVKVRLG
ncbi:MAG: MFS transporter [Simkaniaceae bacterium]|nr:MAG: MFS transporter [Simkaniaceae bacterium]